jgi:hypothetical protein
MVPVPENIQWVPGRTMQGCDRATVGFPQPLRQVIEKPGAHKFITEKSQAVPTFSLEL